MAFALSNRLIVLLTIDSEVLTIWSNESRELLFSDLFSSNFFLDVQLSKTGKWQLGWMSKSGKHINVSLDGKVTH